MKDKYDKYNYMLLDRMVSDCKYAVNNRTLNCLWDGTIDDHIKTMKAIYNLFDNSAKPEWINLEQIENYERLLKAIPVKECVKS